MFLPIFITALLSATAVALPVRRALPTPVSLTTAKTYLAARANFVHFFLYPPINPRLVTVAVDSNSPAYSRDLFKTWDINNHLSSGTCDTRETVLIRDGTNVVTNSACTPTSGKWVSPYDGVATTLASDWILGTLHTLAWLSGARLWTPAQREAFANDLTRPQLISVTDNLNESKGDKDVANWVPPLSSYVCTYVQAWVTVKHFYSLTIDAAEKVALTNYLDGC
ncbi:hypothetical protein BD779DRAFT_1472989 [Infundibulicybe gibba]|nr:hypothetical protein BD779DRAFT_1472989 [Infundibulicybe gibba]